MRLFLSLVFSVICWSAFARPNILLIVTDDQGYGDLSFHGNPVLETPNLDRLCSEGMKFTNGYASHPTCQPSRIAILSGQYAPRTGGYRVMEHHRGKEHLIKYIVPQLTGLALEKTTFAECFKEAGYATAMYGKWHAGNYRKDLHPRYHGFDEAHVCRGHYDDSRSDPPLLEPAGLPERSACSWWQASMEVTHVAQSCAEGAERW